MANTSLYLQKHRYNYVYSKSNREQNYSRVPSIKELLKETMTFKSETDKWVCLHTTDPVMKPGLITPDFLDKYADVLLLVTEYRLEQATNVDILDNLLEKYLGTDVLIPYSMEERRKKYPLAFQELERYMRKYE